MNKLPTAEEASYYRLLVRQGVTCIAFHPQSIPFLKDQVNQHGEAMARENARQQPCVYVPFEETADSWGLNGTLHRSAPTPEGWMCYAISPTKELLRDGAKGYDKEDYAQVVNLAASFNLICASLRSVRVVESPRIEDVVFLEDVQLVTVVSFGAYGCGWPASAAVSHSLMVWLSQLQWRNPPAFAELVNQVRLAMHDTYVRLWPETAQPEHLDYFRLVFDPVPQRRLVLTVPGQACELGGLDRHGSDQERLELHCHNLDSPIQAYALLAGLAKLDELAWQDFGR